MARSSLPISPLNNAESPTAVLTSSAAELEFDEARGWYETQTAGMGTEFVSAVERAIDRLADDPESYPIVWRGKVREMHFPITIDTAPGAGTLITMRVPKFQPGHDAGPPDARRQSAPR